MKTVLLTGGTGALGRLLARELLSYEHIQLILLVRGASDAAARARIAEHSDVPDHVEVYAADVSEKNLGLPKDRYDDLSTRITHILHSAASTRFNSALEDARKNNVETTKHMLDFAKYCTQLVRFGYLSTAMVAGKRTGVIKEDEFEHNAGFMNTYQQSKYEAEALVRKSNLPVIIFRPPLVYTPEESQTSENLTSFLTVLVKLVVSGRIPYVPGTPQSTMDIMDGEESAKILIKLFLNDHLKHNTYHITNGASVVTTSEFRKMMENEKGAPIPIEYCGNGDAGIRLMLEKVSRDERMRVTYERALSFLSEPGYSKVFDNSHTLADLGQTKLDIAATDTLRSAVHYAICSSSK